MLGAPITEKSMSLASLKSMFQSAVATAEAKIAADVKGEIASLETPAGRAAAADAVKGFLTDAMPVLTSLGVGAEATAVIAALPTVEKVADVAAAVL
jgi:hypothetical protein